MKILNRPQPEIPVCMYIHCMYTHTHIYIKYKKSHPPKFLNKYLIIWGIWAACVWLMNSQTNMSGNINFPATVIPWREQNCLLWLGTDSLNFVPAQSVSKYRKIKQFIYLAHFYNRLDGVFREVEGVAMKPNLLRLSALLIPEGCQMTHSDQQAKSKWWKTEIKRIKTSKKAARRATLKRKGVGSSPPAVLMTINIDKDRVKGGGLLGAPWHTNSEPAALPCDAVGIITHH